MSSEETAAAHSVVQNPNYATVDRTILGSYEHLVDYYSAHHIGVSKKIRNGQKLSYTCITFYVMKKGHQSAKNLVPPFLDLQYQSRYHRKIATDVCEIGEEPVGLSIRGGNAIFGSDNEQGTVGLVFRQGDSDFLITNAHVVTDPGELPGPVTVRLPNSDVRVGGIVRKMDDLSAPKILSDAALVEMPLNSVEPGKFRGTDLILAGYSEIENNDPRKFFFVSMDFVYEARWAAWVAGSAPITVDGKAMTYAGFHKFRITVGQAAHGNSGSVVFCLSNTGLVAVGLLFGGALAINEVWVFSIRNTLSKLGIPV